MGVQLCSLPKKKTHSKTTESFFPVHHLLLAIAGFYVLSLLPILNNLQISKVTVQVEVFNLDENEPVNMKKTICPRNFSVQLLIFPPFRDSVNIIYLNFNSPLA